MMYNYYKIIIFNDNEFGYNIYKKYKVYIRKRVQTNHDMRVTSWTKIRFINNRTDTHQRLTVHS